MKLEKGLRVWVKLGKHQEAGIVLDFADSPNGNYQQAKVELLKVNTFAPGQQLLRNVYPKPVQSYKLTKRLNSLPGEDESNE